MMENEGPGGQGQSASFGLNASRQCNRLAEDRHKAGAGRHNAAGDRALTGGLLTSIYPHWQFLCAGFNTQVLCLSLPVGACTTTLYQATEQVLRRDCWDETSLQAQVAAQEAGRGVCAGGPLSACRQPSLRPSLRGLATVSVWHCGGPSSAACAAAGQLPLLG